MELKTGYKNTELGVIPEGWIVRDIINDCSLKARIGWQGLKKTEYLKYGSYLLITGTDFKEGFIDYDTCAYVDKFRYIQDRNIQVRNGDILITKDGTIGKVALVKDLLLPATLNSGVFVLRPTDESLFDNKYLSFVFKSFYFVDFLNKLTAGSTIVHLYQKDFKNFIIPLPPKPEQEKIASVLSDIDAMIAATEALIVKKKQLKVGAMQELLKPKDGWEKKKLGEVGKITMGQSPLSKYYNQKELGLPLVQGNSDIKNRKTIIRNYTEQITKQCRGGDVIMSVRAPVGTVGKAEFNACLGRGVCAIQSENDFLYQYLIYIENDWANFSKGSTFDSINSKELYDIDVCLPISVIEQIQIATILSDMDKEIELLEKKLAKQKMLKVGAMQELLTGKTRLMNF